jgi:hypothetical protein
MTNYYRDPGTYHVYDPALADACARAIDLAKTLGRVLSLTLAADSILDLGSTCDGSAHAFADALARDLGKRLFSIQDLIVGRERALHLAHELTHAHALVPAFNLDLDLVRTLDLAIDLSYILADDLGRALGYAPDHDRAQAGSARPLEGAVRLAGAAAAILPRADRPRYAEEYQTELADLAVTGTGRWRQLCYVARLLTRAPLLRAELILAAHRRRETA